MVEIYEFEVSKQRLAAMPDDERSFLIFLGHATNEISCLSKLVIMAGNVPTTHKLIDHVHTGQSLILLRLLIGKCYEAWKLFRKAAVSQKYADDLTAAAKETQGNLGKRLGPKGIMYHVRQIAFHYPNKNEEIDEAFRSLSEHEPWLFYLSDTIGNSFYFASELVMQRMMINKIENTSGTKNDNADEMKKFQEIFTTTIDVSRELIDLFIAYLGVIIERHFGNVNATPVVKLNAPDLNKVSIPFFVDR